MYHKRYLSGRRTVSLLPIPNHIPPWEVASVANFVGALLDIVHGCANNAMHSCLPPYKSNLPGILLLGNETLQI